MHLLDLLFSNLLAGKLEVLGSHPDLAGRLAASELTRESADEQRSAGLNELTAEQKAAMDASNER